jgi:hypothetical protein
MTNSTLRAALEELTADLRSQTPDPDSTAVTVMRHIGAQLAGMLAADPAGPAVIEIHHHDVENHAASFNEGYDEAQRHGIGGTESRDWLIGKVLPIVKDHVIAEDVAAVLLSETDLSPAEPAPDRQPSDAAIEAAEREYEAFGATLGDAIVAAYRVDAPRPLLHLGDVLAALEEVYQSGAQGGEWPTLGADAVMERARPMPTREQLGIFLHSFDAFAIESGEQWSECSMERQGAFLYQADALLALLNGAES